MKLNNKQKKVLEMLILDLDELDNKPRRLFYALEKFAIAFDKKNAVPTIREAQDSIYSHINEGDTYSELFTSLRKFKIEEWENQLMRSPDDVSGSEERIKGAEDFIKTHIRELTEIRFN